MGNRHRSQKSRRSSVESNDESGGAQFLQVVCNRYSALHLTQTADLFGIPEGRIPLPRALVIFLPDSCIRRARL
jgi:hypothetical protein